MKDKILLHSCCAPCFAGVIEEVRQEYEVSTYWCNPNIYPKEEFQKRYVELLRLAKQLGVKIYAQEEYDSAHKNWLKLTAHFSDQKEGDKRCEICIRLRLIETALMAERKRIKHFGTTLSVSRHKNTDLINRIGKEVEEQLNRSLNARDDSTAVKFIEFDFKKNDGEKKSIELCKNYGIYRQKYCGCEFSLN